jgi:hypothetical protein
MKLESSLSNHFQKAHIWQPSQPGSTHEPLEALQMQTIKPWSLGKRPENGQPRKTESY